MDLYRKVRLAVLQPKAHGPLGEFGRILIQDGCSFAVKETLHEQYPGRFNKQNPAAVELHVTMSLLDESVEEVTRQLHNLPVRTSVRPAEHEVLEP